MVCVRWLIFVNWLRKFCNLRLLKFGKVLFLICWSCLVKVRLNWLWWIRNLKRLLISLCLICGFCWCWVINNWLFGCLGCGWMWNWWFGLMFLLNVFRLMVFWFGWKIVILVMFVVLSRLMLLNFWVRLGLYYLNCVSFFRWLKWLVVLIGGWLLWLFIMSCIGMLMWLVWLVCVVLWCWLKKLLIGLRWVIVLICVRVLWLVFVILICLRKCSWMMCRSWIVFGWCWFFIILVLVILM